MYIHFVVNERVISALVIHWKFSVRIYLDLSPILTSLGAADTHAHTHYKQHLKLSDRDHFYCSLIDAITEFLLAKSLFPFPFICVPFTNFSLLFHSLSHSYLISLVKLNSCSAYSTFQSHHISVIISLFFLGAWSDSLQPKNTHTYERIRKKLVWACTSL